MCQEHFSSHPWWPWLMTLKSVKRNNSKYFYLHQGTEQIACPCQYSYPNTLFHTLHAVLRREMLFMIGKGPKSDGWLLAIVQPEPHAKEKSDVMAENATSGRKPMWLFGISQSTLSDELKQDFSSKHSNRVQEWTYDPSFFHRRMLLKMS